MSYQQVVTVRLGPDKLEILGPFDRSGQQAPAVARERRRRLREAGLPWRGKVYTRDCVGPQYVDALIARRAVTA